MVCQDIEGSNPSVTHQIWDFLYEKPLYIGGKASFGVYINAVWCNSGAIVEA
jgi:hypothetical protein